MSFYVTGGTLSPHAQSYVQRQADCQLLEGLLQGEFCYVLTSRQMGKSSLMLRAATHLNELGIKVAALDLTAIGAQDVTPEQWYYGVLDLVSEALDLREPLESSWKQNEKLGPLQRLMTAIQEVVLSSIATEDNAGAKPLSPESRSSQDPKEGLGKGQAAPGRVRLVIFLDEIDIVRSLAFSVDGFFAAIRECYNRRAQDPAYESLAFCLLGVATPTDLIRDTRRTPFNIGRRIELNDFTAEEAEPLVPGLVTPQVDSAVARRLLARILYWTGGHPYLTQRLCQEAADVLRKAPALELRESWFVRQKANRLIDQLCSDLFLSNRALKRDSNLNFVSEHLLRNESERASLLDLYRKVLCKVQVPDDELDSFANQLRLAGIVRASAGELVVRNRIYARAFNREWVRANMPAAELRRQREAFRSGVALATAVSILVIALMAELTLFALKTRNAERITSARAYFSEAKAQRMSGRSGQRIASLAALNSARRHHPNLSQLRDEAAAALTLMDLQERPDWTPHRARKVAAIATDLSVAAQIEPDSSVTLFNPTNHSVLGKLPKLSPKPRRLRFSPDGAILLVDHTSGSGGRLTVWNWAKAQQLFPALDLRMESRAIDFSADGLKLAIGTTNGTVEIYSLPSGKRERKLEIEPPIGLPRIPNVVRFSPNGEFLAESSSDDYRVQIWRLADGLPASDPLSHTATVHDIAWGDGGKYLGSACGDEAIYLWNADNFAASPIKLWGHSEDVLRLAFSHRGNLIASIGQDGTIRLWSLASERQLVLHEHQAIDEISFSAEDDHLICAAADQTRVDLLKVEGGEHQMLRANRGRSGDRSSLDFSPDGLHLLAALSGEVSVFDLAAMRQLAPVPVPKAHGAFFAANGRDIVVSTDRGLFKYGIHRTPVVEEHLPPPLTELTAMALSPDRQRFAVAHRKEVLVFDVRSISLLYSKVIGQHYHYLALHPREAWLAAMAKNSPALAVWNLDEGSTNSRPIPLLASEQFTFDPSGRWLILSRPGQFHVLQTGSWNEHKVSNQPRRQSSTRPGPVAVNSSGTLLAVASSHDTIDLWRLPQENESAELERITTLQARKHLESLTFSTDGTWLGATTKDTKGALIELWNLKRIWNGLRPYLEKRFDFAL